MSFDRLKSRICEWLIDTGLKHHPSCQSSNIVRYAEDEMRRANLYGDATIYGGMLPEAVLRLVKINAIEGHSGGSHGITQSIFRQVVSYRPLTPLLGTDDEWNEVGTGVWQNKRCATIFKEADGKAYNSEGIIFEEPSGAQFTNRKSRSAVAFPWKWTEPAIVKVSA